MIKKKKLKYITVICPICKWKTVGNWKNKQLSDYLVHWMDEHYVEPIIKTSNARI